MIYEYQNMFEQITKIAVLSTVDCFVQLVVICVNLYLLH